MSQPTKALRFANRTRVSTEGQEKYGESLRTQKQRNEKDVERLGGVIVGLYAGQEHATPGFPTPEFDRLLEDAAKGLFDAVIVSYPDRLSRDPVKSALALETFKKYNIRLYVSGIFQDLHQPHIDFQFDMNAAVGKLLAAISAKKSLEVKIDSAKEGKPTCGKLPHGRSYDKETGWGVDEEKKAQIQDIARRYLAGEAMPKLAKEVGKRRGSIHRILTTQCDDTWVQNFRSARFKIDESIPTPVPPLLDKETLKAIRAKLKANRTFDHRPHNRKHDYLLSGKVFCAGCGYHMFGQPGFNPYYKHGLPDERKRPCPVCEQLGRRPGVRAADLERLVVEDLFQMFGNPEAIERAVKAAVPDCEKLQKRRAKVVDELAKKEKATNYVLTCQEQGLITDAVADARLKNLKEATVDLLSELDKLDETLAELPDAESIEVYVQCIKRDGINIVTGKPLGNEINVFSEEVEPQVAASLREQGWSEEEINRIAVQQPGGNDLGTLLSMTQEDRRKLVQAVFNCTQPNGDPAGVYVTVLPKLTGRRARPFRYELRGRCQYGDLPFAWAKKATEPGGTVARNGAPSRSR
jgi:DNA invertase Pin-like site-specific DNA recombinase